MAEVHEHRLVFARLHIVFFLSRRGSGGPCDSDTCYPLTSPMSDHAACASVGVRNERLCNRATKTVPGGWWVQPMTSEISQLHGTSCFLACALRRILSNPSAAHPPPIQETSLHRGTRRSLAPPL